MHSIRAWSASVFALFGTIPGCQAESPPPPPATAVASVSVGDGGVAPVTAGNDTSVTPLADAGPDFYSCASDSDCVAVPKVGCCFNGHMEAVNKSSVDAYKASFTCDNKRPICPQYRILDKRVAQCADSPAGAAKKCEMMKAEDIACGTAHQCPQGFACQSGKCAGTAP